MPKTDCKPLPRLSEADITRFNSKVDRSPGQGPKGDCHRWIGGLWKNGYGRFKARRKDLKAHRVALFLCTGVDPFPLLACHTCDWEPCCNGTHLFRGTVEENVRDRDRKGRTASGDRNGSRLHPERLARGDNHYAHITPGVREGAKNGRAILSNEQVLEIRCRHANGDVSFADLGREFNLTKENIGMIVRRQTWKHV